MSYWINIPNRFGMTWGWVKDDFCTNNFFRALFCLLSGSFLTKQPFLKRCVHKYRFVIPGFHVYFRRSDTAMPRLQFTCYGLRYRHIVFPDVTRTRCTGSGFRNTVSWLSLNTVNLIWETKFMARLACNHKSLSAALDWAWRPLHLERCKNAYYNNRRLRTG